MTTSHPASPQFDPQQQADAAQINAVNPRWLVLWGVSSRRFWAFPAFAVRRGTIVSATDAATLVERMHTTELASQDH